MVVKVKEKLEKTRHVKNKGKFEKNISSKENNISW